MSDADTIELEFSVACSREHAFEVFTSRTSSWWPPRHTRSGNPASVTIEPRGGGRIFERTGAGEEHDWGEVIDWEPPSRLRYLWHIYGAPRAGDRGRDPLRGRGAADPRPRLSEWIRPARR